jgi:hypothetical protein
MTREDLFCELSDVIFALAPAPGARHDDISREDVEDVRRQLVAKMDAAAMRVEQDSAFTVEEAADDRGQQELDEVGRD